MPRMRCRHCRTPVEYAARDVGVRFDCAACGRAGLYGYGLNDAESQIPAADATAPFAADAAYAPPEIVDEQPIDAQANPSPATPRSRRFSAGRLLKIAACLAVTSFAVFGLVRKGTKVVQLGGAATHWLTGTEETQPVATKSSTSQP